MTMHSTQTVARWLRRICGHEGDFTDDPRDKGNWTGGEVGAGELKGTRWGISAASYPDLDIASITQDEAAALYLEDYLAPLRANLYPDGVAFQLLDFAIHSGPRTAKKQLQQALGVPDDGIIGPVTLARMYEFTEAQLCLLLIGERLDFLTDTSAWQEYSRGIAKRIAKNMIFASNDCAEEFA